MTFLRSYLDWDMEPHIEDSLSQEAFQSQMDIGQHLLIRGFLSIEWLHLLTHAGYTRPDNAIIKLILFIWDKIVHPIWTTRNTLLHKLQNLTTSAAKAQLTSRLHWFLNNKHTALARRDFFLARYTGDEINCMKIHTKKECLRHLEAAHASWEIECLQCQKGQSVITTFFTRQTVTPNSSAQWIPHDTPPPIKIPAPTWLCHVGAWGAILVDYSRRPRGPIRCT